MSLMSFYLHLGAMCGGLGAPELAALTDDRLLRRGISDTPRAVLKSMALSALNPEDLPVTWRVHRDGETPNFAACYGSSVNGPKPISQEELLVTVRAAFMYFMPAMSIRSITEATVAFAMRWLCSDPATVTYILPFLLDKRPPPVWSIVDDTAISKALCRMGFLPAPRLVPFSHLTAYMKAARGEGWDASPCSVDAVIDFITTALKWHDPTVWPYDPNDVDNPPDTSTDGMVTSIASTIEGRHECVNAHVREATRRFIQLAYPEEPKSALDAFANVCQTQFDWRRELLRKFP